MKATDLKFFIPAAFSMLGNYARLVYPMAILVETQNGSVNEKGWGS
jgi:hypothetical protein